MTKKQIKFIAKWEGGKNGNPVLFFPEYAANPGNIVSYAHIGQHSEACLSYYTGLKNCRSLEQKAALRELIAEYSQKLEPDETLAQVYRDKDAYRKERYSHDN